eukprot:TRINITY_DN74007_c0_g1_i1.p1 TRINITY_DN74007_c0_g1~~TRINITY_DN74007_c0_g1_i1.p1  ORF type:complete len:210 (-),score=38.61 TRINITY_DN74007_c0_g1_i1:107-736(-)
MAFSCPIGHAFKDYCAQGNNVTCKVCKHLIPKGNHFKGDKACSLSACLDCAKKQYCSSKIGESCSQEAARQIGQGDTAPVVLLPRRPIPYSQGMSDAQKNILGQGDSQRTVCKPGKKADASAMLSGSPLDPMRLQKDTLGYIGLHRDMYMPAQPRVDFWDEECSPPETLSSIGPEQRNQGRSGIDIVAAQEEKALDAVNENETLQVEVL